MNLDHPQPEKQILAKRPRLHERLEIFVCRRHQSHIGRQCLVRPHALVRSLAEKPQQFHLNRRVDFPDLIQKKRPALRLLEAPDAPLVRARERALLVPKQLALQQRRRERRAMHRHQRKPRARAALVNALRDQFLAGAAFARDQNRRPRRRNLLHDVEHLLHHGRFTDDTLQTKLPIQPVMQRLIFLLERSAPQRAGDAQFEFVDLQPPLRDVIIRALLHRLHRDILRTVRRHQNAHRRFVQRFRALDQLHAVLLRQPQVREQHGEILALKQAHRRRGVLRHINVVMLLERRAQPLARRLLVIHNEQHRFLGHGAEN